MNIRNIILKVLIGINMYEISIQIHLTITNGMSRYHNMIQPLISWGGGGAVKYVYWSCPYIFHKFSLFLQVRFCFYHFLFLIILKFLRHNLRV